MTYIHPPERALLVALPTGPWDNVQCRSLPASTMASGPADTT
jgi:hypothetical protein